MQEREREITMNWDLLVDLVLEELEPGFYALDGLHLLRVWSQFNYSGTGNCMLSV